MCGLNQGSEVRLKQCYGNRILSTLNYHEDLSGPYLTLLGQTHSFDWVFELFYFFFLQSGDCSKSIWSNSLIGTVSFHTMSHKICSSISFATVSIIPFSSNALLQFYCPLTPPSVIHFRCYERKKRKLSCQSEKEKDFALIRL